jgi:hypothetical protein
MVDHLRGDVVVVHLPELDVCLLRREFYLSPSV